MGVTGGESIPKLVCLELAQRGGQGGGTEKEDENYWLWGQPGRRTRQRPMWPRQ